PAPRHLRAHSIRCAATFRPARGPLGRGAPLTAHGPAPAPDRILLIQDRRACMKFTDGYWRLRPGVQLTPLTAIRDWRAGPDALTLYVGPRPIAARGADLNEPLLEVRLSSPAPEVIRVQVTHHKGAANRGPSFTLMQSEDATIDIQETEEALRFQSGRLAVV